MEHYTSSHTKDSLKNIKENLVFWWFNVSNQREIYLNKPL